MPFIVRTTFLEVRHNGVPLDDVLSARVSLGFDMAVAEASVVLAAEPDDLSYNDTIEIFMGAGGDDGNNNALRFTGLFKQVDRTLWPRSITLLLKGPLSRAAEFKPQVTDSEAAARQSAGISGILLPDLTGSTTPSDQDVVLAALELVPDLDPNIATIDGTGTNLGGLPPDAAAWGFQETALAFIQRIDTASQGYRTFESIGGSIYRVRIAGWPGGDHEFTFTEDVDIFEGRSTRTILELKNRARVDGYDYGLGAGIISFTADGGGDLEVQFSTSLAGRVHSGDNGPGFACEDIANYLLSEWNRELVRLTLTTPRDDIIGPGQTHLVTTISGEPDRLGTAEPLWVQRVEISVDEKGVFSQTITYLGGGESDGFDSPIDWDTD